MKQFGRFIAYLICVTSLISFGYNILVYSAYKIAANTSGYTWISPHDAVESSLLFLEMFMLFPVALSSYVLSQISGKDFFSSFLLSIISVSEEMTFLQSELIIFSVFTLGLVCIWFLKDRKVYY